MANIKLMRLTLDNFKGQHHLDFQPEGRSCSIFGDNAAGKTTVYDAFVWLLFGKDSLGRKDFDIKPLLPDGTVADRAAITRVEAVLDVDGTEKILKRFYYEKWSTKRGRSEATYDGNSSDYYVDDVPVKKGAFDAEVAGMVDEDTFRMLTSVTYFPEQMKWQQRRTLLCDWAGVRSDREIMATDDRFAPLADAMGAKSLDDYKKMVTSRRKGMAKDKTDIPARIDEQLSTVQELEKVDFASMRERREALAVDEERLKGELYSLRSQNRTEDLEHQLRAAQADLRALEERNRAHRAQQTAGRENPTLIQSDIDRLKIDIQQTRKLIDRVQSDISRQTKYVDDAREEWFRISQEKFSGRDTCPSCGQKLPKDRIDDLIRQFDSDKESRLRRIMEKANLDKASIEENKKLLSEYESSIKQMEPRYTARLADLDAAKNQAPAEDLPEYAAEKNSITAQIEKLKDQIRRSGTSTHADELAINDEIRSTRNAIAALDASIAQEARLMAARSRVEELRAQANKITAELEELDGILFLIEDFSRYKAGFVEESINSLFQHATFRLFREQINGGLEECCDVMYHGVPYQADN